MWKKFMGIAGLGILGSSAAYMIPISSGYVSFPANLPIEDRYVVGEIPSGRLAAVFDGHGGWQVSEYLHKHIKSKIESNIKGSQNWEQIMSKTFDDLESELIESVKGSYSLGFSKVSSVGACAVVAVVIDNNLIVANSGDCQAVLVSSSPNGVKGENICEIHSSNLKSEQERLAKEHPLEEDIVRCKHPKACYVKGRLMPSRAFGDFHLKYEEFNNPKNYSKVYGFKRSRIENFTGPYITHKPDIKIRKINSQDKFLILASDGLWDEMTEQEAAEIAFNANDPQEAAKLLLDAALNHAAKESNMTLESLLSQPFGRKRNIHDDITIVIVPLYS
jgi:pyruvate dehydrogenase phosphatase